MAIIKIDMANPLSYAYWTDERVTKVLRMARMAKKFKLHKIPHLYPLNKRCLTKDEINQQNLLMRRNAFNVCYANEGKKVLKNAKIVRQGGIIECPMLLFISNGKQIDNYWSKSQQKFSSVMNATLICFDYGHYIHYYKIDEMSKKIIEFSKNI